MAWDLIPQARRPNWNTLAKFVHDTDIDCDGNRPALDQDSDADILPDGWVDGANQPFGQQNGKVDVGEYEDWILTPTAQRFNGMICGDTNGDRVMDAGETWCETDPMSGDTDGDGWFDGEEVLGDRIPAPYPGGGGGQSAKQTCNPMKADSDDDGLTDWEEGRLNGTDMFDNKAGVQVVIGDGYVTDCEKADTDDGGLSDWAEFVLINGLGPDGLLGTMDDTAHYAFNPQNGTDDMSDRDGDGLSNADEILWPGACLNWLKADTDSDGWLDGPEVWGSLNPWFQGVKSGPPGDPTNPCSEDSDGDLVGDYDEAIKAGTNPNDADTDNDGLTDGQELFVYLTDPLNPDSDGDGLTDGAEVNVHKTDPNKKDTDGDGMSDGYEVAHIACLNPKVKDAGGDPDADGLTNLQESKLGTNPCNKDTDGDGMFDGAEAKYSCLNPLVADATGDADGDTWSNAAELAAGSNPCLKDTDGDTLNDNVDPWPLSPDGDQDGMPDVWEVKYPCVDPKVARTRLRIRTAMPTPISRSTRTAPARASSTARSRMTGAATVSWVSRTWR